MIAPLATFGLIQPREADRLLEDWEHYLGPCNRPFGRQDFALEVNGVGLVAVATSASTVGSTSAGLPRREVMELARLVRHPGHPWATASCLRLWQALAPARWPYWEVKLLVSYCSLKEHGPGGGKIYQLAGWKKHGVKKGSVGGGTWSKAASSVTGGAKILWTYEPT